MGTQVKDYEFLTMVMGVTAADCEDIVAAVSDYLVKPPGDLPIVTFEGPFNSGRRKAYHFMVLKSYREFQTPDFIRGMVQGYAMCLRGK